jgi:hypothetical protein
MNFCATSCRSRVKSQRAALFAGVEWLAFVALACGPELDTDIAQPDPPAYSACLSELEQTYAGARYDSALLLGCSAEQCGDSARSAVTSLIDANGHQLRRSFPSLSMLVVDVGSPEEVLPWACRYKLDPAYAGAFGEAFPNLEFDLQ